jgi:hypothetical protein
LTTGTDYSIVIGREDKHEIVRYDANSDIFKKTYYQQANPSPLKGSWSLNFGTFIPINSLPSGCQHSWKKTHFWANIAIDINGVCHHWEFNQGHIWRLINDKKELEEDYTFKIKRSGHKLCMKFTTRSNETNVKTTTKIAHNAADPQCKLLITFPIEHVHYQTSSFSPKEFRIKIEDPSRRHIIRLRQDSHIARNPIINMTHGSKKVSINFARYLSEDQYPTNAGCGKARK